MYHGCLDMLKILIGRASSELSPTESTSWSPTCLEIKDLSFHSFLAISYVMNGLNSMVALRKIIPFKDLGLVPVTIHVT